MFGSEMAALIISNKNYIMKIVRSLEESDLLIKCTFQTSKNEPEEQEGGFLDMLLGTLAASLLGSALAAKRVIRCSY